jgi:hypothetical protein
VGDVTVREFRMQLQAQVSPISKPATCAKARDRAMTIAGDNPVLREEFPADVGLMRARLLAQGSTVNTEIAWLRMGVRSQTMTSGRCLNGRSGPMTAAPPQLNQPRAAAVCIQLCLACSLGRVHRIPPVSQLATLMISDRNDQLPEPDADR